MKTWIKVGIGCVALGIIVFFLMIAGLVGFGYWAKGRIQEATGGGPAAEAARKQANAVPFVRPENGAIPEPRFLKFLEVQAEISTVYDRYRDEMKSRVKSAGEGRGLDLSDVSTGLTFISEMKRAEALALAKHGMPEAEYAFIAAEVRLASLTSPSSTDPATDAVARAVEAAQKASAHTAGLPPEAAAAIEEAKKEISQDVRDAVRESVRSGPSPANTALFKKYEAELRKYRFPVLLFTPEVNQAAPSAVPPASPASK